MTVPVQTAEPARLEKSIDTYLEDYICELDEDMHTPDEFERFVIKDAIMGLLVDDEFCAALREGAVQPAEASPEPDETRRDDFERWADREGFNIHRDESDKYRGYHRATTRFAWQGWLAALVPGPAEAPSKSARKFCDDECVTHCPLECGIEAERRRREKESLMGGIL